MNPFRPDGLLTLEYVFSEEITRHPGWISFNTSLPSGPAFYDHTEIRMANKWWPAPPWPCQWDRNALPYTRDR